MTLPLAERALFFVYGTRNLVGCLFALLACIFCSLETIDGDGLLLVAAFYLGGFLLAPARTASNDDPVPLSGDPLFDRLDHLLRATRMQLPAEAHARLGDIRVSAGELVPRLREVNNEAALEAARAVTRALGRELPLALDHYLRLPAAFAAVHRLKAGRTADRMLQEYLDGLHRALTRLLAATLKHDAGALARHGRLLSTASKRIQLVAGA